MKSKFAKIGLLLALSIMATSIISVQATEIELPSVTIKKNGVIWDISTQDYFGAKFNGKDVYPTTIVVKYWIETSDGLIYSEIVPSDIKLTPNKITLIFDLDDLPTEPVDGTSITGELIGGDTFLATGPGFAWRRR